MGALRPRVWLSAVLYAAWVMQEGTTAAAGGNAAEEEANNCAWSGNIGAIQAYCQQLHDQADPQAGDDEEWQYLHAPPFAPVTSLALKPERERDRVPVRQRCVQKYLQEGLRSRCTHRFCAVPRPASDRRVRGLSLRLQLQPFGAQTKTRGRWIHPNPSHNTRPAERRPQDS